MKTLYEEFEKAQPVSGYDRDALLKTLLNHLEAHNFEVIFGVIFSDEGEEPDIPSPAHMPVSLFVLEALCSKEKLKSTTPADVTVGEALATLVSKFHTEES